MYTDSGTLRVTIREAASRLGVTEGAIRKRIQRGSLPREQGEGGRVYVYLDEYQDMSQPESQIDSDPLVEELRDRVRFLEKELERRGDEGERYQRIIAGLAQSNSNLTDRLKELKAPEPSQEDVKKHAEWSEDEESVGEDANLSTRSAEKRQGWWRRVFGG